MRSLTLPNAIPHSTASAGFEAQAGVPEDVQNLFPGLLKLQDTALTGDTILIPERVSAVPLRRLVVLVPDGETDDRELARRIWLLASGLGLQVLYLALPLADSWEAYHRRRVADLALMTSGAMVRAQTEVSVEKSWQRAYQGIECPGDLVVCLGSPKNAGQPQNRKPLGELLAENIGVPVYMMMSVTIGPALHRQKRIRELGGWIAAIVMIGTFFALQIAIDRSTSGQASTISLCLAVLVEFFLLWKINDWIG
jgi:hypothetical protein